MQKLPESVFLESEAAMVEFGERLGFYLQTHSVGCVFLNGQLGAGKTTLVRGILRSFGYLGAVKSPTFTLVEVYEFPNARVNHFDLYRLKDPEELEFMGIRDYFTERDVTLLEWPEKGEEFLPEPDLTIFIQPKNLGREIHFQTNIQTA